MTVQDNSGAGAANVPATSGAAVAPPQDALAEIQCPACEARYRVPMTALGSGGRKVQCASCGEVWHATALAPPPPPPAPEPAPQAAAPEGGFAERLAEMRGGAATAEETAAAEVPGNSAEGPDTVAEGQRDQQMAEIRRMLDDIKGEDRSGGEGELGISLQPPPQTQTVVKDRDVAGIERMAPAADAPAARESYSDPLREKLLDADTKVRRGQDTEQQRAGLMRRHQKRSRRRQAAAEQRRSRSGFYTGLILIVMVGTMMAGTYIFADRLAERMPGAAPALAEYKVTIDGALAEGRAMLDRVTQRVNLVIEEMFAE
ncbi:MAG: zinc-ribbon domain-containing protein [Pseudomonadota bacterium]